MKKFLAGLLAALAAVSLLAGCSADDDIGSGNGGGGSGKYVILDETLKDEEYAVGFRKGDVALRNEVQKALVELKNDGTLAEISKKWFGEDKITVPDTFTPLEVPEGDKSLEEIKERENESGGKGMLILGLDDALPPMGFQNDNWEIDGFDIDVAKKVCEKMGVELKLQPIDWKAKDSELNGKKIDCIWNGFTVTEERKNEVLFTEPYMTNRQVVVTMDDSGISTLADLAGKTVTLQEGSTASDALDASPELKDSLKEVILIKDNVLALNDLKKGGCDAVIMDEVVARYYTSHAELITEGTTGASDTADTSGAAETSGTSQS